MASGGREEEFDSVDYNYRILVSTFPCIDKNYIRDICFDPPFHVSEGEPLLDKLENYLLDCLYGNNVPESSHMSNLFTLHERELGVNDDLNNEVSLDVVQENQQQVNETASVYQELSELLRMQDFRGIGQKNNSIEAVNDQLLIQYINEDKRDFEEKLKTLVNILPDANPVILRKFLEENQDNGHSLEEFVESNLINKDYEKREQYFTKLKNKEKIEKYVTNFKVEEFLKDFPEPFEHFESIERIKPYQEKALNFLKNRYSDYKGQLVSYIYVTYKHNLSIADNIMQMQLGYIPLLQLNIEVDDVPLLQEIAFIQNKEAIRSHLKVLKQREDKELQLLRAQELLLECQCCFDDLKPYECIECESDHIFCKRCVIKATSLAISKGEVAVSCLAECNKEISFSVLRRILPEPKFDALLKKRQEFEISEAKLNNLVTCPFCPYSEEIDPQIKIFSCKNPECMKISCRLCKKLNHIPIKCKDVPDEHKGRLFVEEEMSKALIRNCYKCNKPFIKKKGCNKMTCECGAKMCYICRQPVIGRSHGGSCRIHSEMFDETQVQLRRIQATSTLRKDFQELKLPDT